MCHQTLDDSYHATSFRIYLVLTYLQGELVLDGFVDAHALGELLRVLQRTGHLLQMLRSV